MKTRTADFSTASMFVKVPTNPADRPPMPANMSSTLKERVPTPVA